MNKAYDRQSFLQDLATFFRENVCRAGISSEYKDILKTGSAVSCARAALEIGSEENPHLWYHTFDDIRLEYMMRKCREEIAPELLCHPVLEILKEYDSNHKSELNRTLKMYIENHLNMSAAADKPYIHRTSFMRRIEKIKELTGADLEDPDVILALAVSYKISK